MVEISEKRYPFGGGGWRVGGGIRYHLLIAKTNLDLSFSLKVQDHDSVQLSL